MVKIKKKDKEVYYVCEECGYLYKEKKWAKKCEAWCKEHQSCNLEILERGVPNENVE